MTQVASCQKPPNIYTIYFHFTGAHHFDSGPSHGVPDQNNPEKYLNHNPQHLVFIVDNTLYYKDFPM